MQYYRCKCGTAAAYGSMPPPQCEGCEACGTTLELFPVHWTEPKPHHWHETKVETDAGFAPLTVCLWCGVKKKDLEKA